LLNTAKFPKKFSFKTFAHHPLCSENYKNANNHSHKLKFQSLPDPPPTSLNGRQSQSTVQQSVANSQQPLDATKAAQLLLQQLVQGSSSANKMESPGRAAAQPPLTTNGGTLGTASTSATTAAGTQQVGGH
jgi:hypothetical protein